MVKFVCIGAICLLAISSAFACTSVRNYGHGSPVCVCNAQHCDTLKPFHKTEKGVVTSFVTSKGGDRLKESHLHLAQKSSLPSPTISVNIDHTKRYQKIVGFGGAFTDSAGINIAKLPKDLQHRLIQDYYGEDGIEYTTGRIPIGGSDFSTRQYTYDDHPGDESLSKFALQLEDLHYKIPFIEIAKQVSKHHVKWFGSPWAAPAWMKTNHEISHGGLLIGKPGEKYYKMFAKYLVKFIQEYEKHNIPMWGITIENEPGAGFNPKHPWNSLGFNATLERDFIKLDLGPELHQHGYNKDKLKVMIYDDQLPMMKNFAHTVLNDHEAAKYVAGIAFHWYWNDRPEANRHDIDELAQQYKDVFILATEACLGLDGSHKSALGYWGSVNLYAVDIIEDLNHYSAGWTDWNIVLDYHGGPNWINNFVDAPIIVNETSHEYYKQPYFYALGHFSKYLVPDSVRIHHEAHTNDHKLLVTVFERPDQGTVLTILNKNNHPIDLQVHDPQHGYIDVHVQAEALQTLIWY